MVPIRFLKTHVLTSGETHGTVVLHVLVRRNFKSRAVKRDMREHGKEKESIETQKKAHVWTHLMV